MDPSQSEGCPTKTSCFNCSLQNKQGRLGMRFWKCLPGSRSNLNHDWIRVESAPTPCSFLSNIYQWLNLSRGYTTILLTPERGQLLQLVSRQYFRISGESFLTAIFCIHANIRRFLRDFWRAWCVQKFTFTFLDEKNISWILENLDWKQILVILVYDIRGFNTSVINDIFRFHL